MSTNATILVADDDLPIVQFISEVLADEGYAVLQAHTGAQATSILLSEPLQLALLDLVFGGMSGLDVLRVVRAHGNTVPIIIMTANAPQALSLQNQGAAVCLLKPFDLEDLLACVEQHLHP